MEAHDGIVLRGNTPCRNPAHKPSDDAYYALVNTDGRITDQASGQERTTVHRVEASATALSGRPRVVDGDTIDVGGARVRLHGIDAPESGQSCVAQGARWPCGRRATRALAGRVGGRTVVCEERDRDRYGRIVAVCRQGGRDINAWLVAEGWALAYRRYSREYVDEESTARAARKGVWRGEFVAPWDWRRGKRLQDAARTTGPAPKAASKRCNIKGNISHNSGRRIYHMPGDRDYARTRISPSRGERWFCYGRRGAGGGLAEGGPVTGTAGRAGLASPAEIPDRHAQPAEPVRSLSIVGDSSRDRKN